MKKTSLTPSYPVENSINNLLGQANPDFEEMVRSWFEEDYSPRTLKAISSDLKGFIQWYQNKNGESFSFKRVTPLDGADYKRDLLKEGKKPATINRALVTLRGFFQVAVDKEMLTKNPMNKVKQLPKQALAPKSLTEPEMRKFLKEVEVLGNLRDMALVRLASGAGLRVSELINLTLDDITISERKGTVLLRNGKGNKTRTVPLSQNVRESLTEYLKEQKPKHEVFVGQRGALTAIAVNKIVEKYGKRAGVRLSPHTLRHVFAYNYLQSNPSDIVGLSQLMGHQSINTSAIYTQNRLEDLQERVEKMA